MFCVSVTLEGILQQLCQTLVKIEREGDKTAKNDVSESFIVIIHVKSNNSKGFMSCLAQFCIVFKFPFVESI